jgi:hypothetical protein
LPDSITRSLDTAPSYQVKEVAISDETDPLVTPTVRNTGGRDGMFLCER